MVPRTRHRLLVFTHRAFRAPEPSAPAPGSLDPRIRSRAGRPCCYWLLRKQGLSDREATTRLEGRSVADRNELLFQNGINFNEIRERLTEANADP
jgi:hypothetical protein